MVQNAFPLGSAWGKSSPSSKSSIGSSASGAGASSTGGVGSSQTPGVGPLASKAGASVPVASQVTVKSAGRSQAAIGSVFAQNSSPILRTRVELGPILGSGSLYGPRSHSKKKPDSTPELDCRWL